MDGTVDTTMETDTGWRDYYELTKPRVVMLIVFTAVVGMFLAVPGWPGLQALVFGTLGIGLASSSAAVFNHVLDARIVVGFLRRPDGLRHACHQGTHPGGDLEGVLRGRASRRRRRERRPRGRGLGRGGRLAAHDEQAYEQHGSLPQTASHHCE